MGDWMIGVIAVLGVLTSVCLMGVVLALAQELERAEAALRGKP